MSTITTDYFHIQLLTILSIPSHTLFSFLHAELDALMRTISIPTDKYLAEMERLEKVKPGGGSGGGNSAQKAGAGDSDYDSDEQMDPMNRKKKTAVASQPPSDHASGELGSQGRACARILSSSSSSSSNNNEKITNDIGSDSDTGKIASDPPPRAPSRSQSRSRTAPNPSSSSSSRGGAANATASGGIPELMDNGRPNRRYESEVCLFVYVCLVVCVIEFV